MKHTDDQSGGTSEHVEAPVEKKGTCLVTVSFDGLQHMALYNTFPVPVMLKPAGLLFCYSLLFASRRREIAIHE